MLSDFIESTELIHRVREAHPTLDVQTEPCIDAVIYRFSHPTLGLCLKCTVPLMGRLAPTSDEVVYLHLESDANKAIQAAIQTFKKWQSLGR